MFAIKIEKINHKTLYPGRPLEKPPNVNVVEGEAVNKFEIKFSINPPKSQTHPKALLNPTKKAAVKNTIRAIKTFFLLHKISNIENKTKRE